MKKKERIIGALVILFVAITGAVFMFSFREADLSTKNEAVEIFSTNEQSSKKVDNQSTDDKLVGKDDAVDTKEESDNITHIIVEIKGEVLKPDVYKIKENSRINDLIDLAGGLTDFANTENLNRASIISDGDCIIIGNINEEVEESEIISSSVSKGSVKEGDSDVVNINTADLEKLKTITGIGDTKAQAIMEYREQNGKFKSVDDLTKITGIGEKTLEKIRDKITV